MNTKYIDSAKALIDNVNQLMQSIQVCIQNQYRMPSLILIYALIDILGYLDMPANKMSNNSEDFIKWAERYLKPNMKNQEWTGKDLFGARCGLLHTLTFDSDLSKKGNAKPIYYSWDQHKAEGLKKLSERANIDNIVIHVNDLFTGLTEGIKTFYCDITENDEKIDLVLTRALQFPNNIVLPKDIRYKLDAECSSSQ